MYKRVIIIGFLLLMYAAAMAVYWFKLGYANNAIREGIYLSAPLVAIVSGLFALFKFGFSGRRSRTIMLMTAGVAYWFFGELFFDYYQYITFIDTSPSAADLFYVLGYPFIVGGLLNEIRVVGITSNFLRRPLFFFSIFIAVVLAAVVSYFGIYQAYDATVPSVANVISLGYGVGDLFLVLTSMFLLLLAMEFRGGKLSRIWLTFFLSMLMILIPDILFSFYSQEYNNLMWFYKSLLDSFWIGAYLLFAYAFFEYSFSLQDAYQKILEHVQEKTTKQKGATVQ